MSPTGTTVVRAVVVAAVVAFLGALWWQLVQPGYTQARLALFAALAALAVAGASGVVSRRPWVAGGAACGLLLLGSWQATLWVYVFPVAGVLVVAAAVGAEDPDAD